MTEEEIKQRAKGNQARNGHGRRRKKMNANKGRKLEIKGNKAISERQEGEHERQVEGGGVRR